MRNIFLINDQKEQFKTKETLNSRKMKNIWHISFRWRNKNCCCSLFALLLQTKAKETSLTVLDAFQLTINQRACSMSNLTIQWVIQINATLLLLNATDNIKKSLSTNVCLYPVCKHWHCSVFYAGVISTTRFSIATDVHFFKWQSSLVCPVEIPRYGQVRGALVPRLVPHTYSLLSICNRSGQWVWHQSSFL